MARPTYDDLIEKVLRVVNEYEATLPEDRDKNSVKHQDYLKCVEMLERMCGYLGGSDEDTVRFSSPRTQKNNLDEQ